MEIESELTDRDLTKLWVGICPFNHRSLSRENLFLFLVMRIPQSYWQSLTYFKFTDTVNLKNTSTALELSFEENMFYIYASGIGIFTSRVSERYGGDIKNFVNERDELESRVAKIVQDKLSNINEGYKNKIQDYQNQIRNETAL